MCELADPVSPCFESFTNSYAVDMDVKKLLSDVNLTNAGERLKARKTLKDHFEERYLNQNTAKSEKRASGNQYFFKQLRF